MSKRPPIPQRIREAVLKEFNHRCAICGEVRPQIHHIDESNANNDPLNLLPLCPNCHLTDQHAPTAKLQPEKLALFRKHKDPTILKSEFEPLYRRLKFLDHITDETSVEQLEKDTEELVSFVKALAMGGFYGEKIESLIKKPAWAYIRFLERDDDWEHRKHVSENEMKYRNQLRTVREEVYGLAVELLRYQSWCAEKKS